MTQKELNYDHAYLKPTTKAEPLIWRWYAWSHLIPSINVAYNIVERHLKIMESYVQNPQIHSQALKDLKMLGAPFIDLDPHRMDEIRDLISQTKQGCQQLILLNDAFKELDRVLQSEAQGDSLESYYDLIPSPLKGHIELIYDLNNHPSIRLIEPLIYQTYYSTQNQQTALSETNSDFRKFVLRTPRLDQEDEVYLNIPFSEPKLDRLFKMKEEPQNLDEMQALFDIPQSKLQLFQSFFTTISPFIADDRNYQGEGIRLRYCGHACVLVQTKSVSILVELKEMETITLQDREIIALPFLVEHSDLNIQSKLSYRIQLQDKQFLFAADSNNLDALLYNHIFNYIESIDMLFLGMESDGAPLTWLYGPLLSTPLKRTHDRNRTLSGSNSEKAWKIAEKSNCKAAYVYAMGQEPWLSYIMALKYSPSSPQIIESDKFIQKCRDNAIESERLFGRKEWVVE